MLRQNLWKVVLSGIVLLWAAFSLLPLKDQPFGDYVKAEASAKNAQFATLMAKVSERVKSGQSPTVFVALKQVAREQGGGGEGPAERQRGRLVRDR